MRGREETSTCMYREYTYIIHVVIRRVQGSKVFRNPRALGCSVPSAARALLRAREFLNTVDPVG